MLPGYLSILSPADLKFKSEALRELMKECRICPNHCLSERYNGETGSCNSTDEIIVSSIGKHFGEEPPLVGTLGSGTIFFTNCNLSCVFCQNFDISQKQRGEKISIEELSDAMLYLQKSGCHNINFVTPTHFIPQIVEALIPASEQGLEIPLVYNCGGYESTETLKILEGVIDIYMPDIKYSDNLTALKYSGVKDYWEVVQSALLEMHRQVGDLKISRRGIAKRGLLIRHLVLPDKIGGSKLILDFVANQLSVKSYINIMDQYHPAYQTSNYPELNRYITREEYNEVTEFARNLGLNRGF